MREPLFKGQGARTSVHGLGCESLCSEFRVRELLFKGQGARISTQEPGYKSVYLGAKVRELLFRGPRMREPLLRVQAADNEALKKGRVHTFSSLGYKGSEVLGQKVGKHDLSS